MSNKIKKEAYEPIKMTVVQVELQGVVCQSVVGGFLLGSGSVNNVEGAFSN